MSMNFPAIDIAHQDIPPAPYMPTAQSTLAAPGIALSTRQWLLILLCCVVNTAAGIGLYHLASPKRDKFGVVNLGQVYRDKEQEFTKTLAAPSVTDSDRTMAIKSAQDFAIALPKALQALSDDCACIVLMGNAVGGMPAHVTDLTPSLRKKVGL
jgi:hypothetical protein